MSADLGRAARELTAGGQAYARGDFGAAVQAYQAALDAGADSADAWFDLGDAFYRAGDHGRAALAWERALRRDPGDADARANLQMLRSTSADAAIVGRQSPLSDLGGRLDPDLPAVSLLASFTLACAVLVIRRRVRGDAARTVWALAGVVLLLLAGAAGGATLLAQRARDPDRAVVIADSAPVRAAPLDDAAPAFELHGGTLVRVTSATGAFAEIRLPSGLTGFLLWRDLEAIAR